MRQRGYGPYEGIDETIFNSHRHAIIEIAGQRHEIPPQLSPDCETIIAALRYFTSTG
ncbi:hypothetical protein [Corynebacterium cystitidis]|uniref:hypothetical protein n=1 Tax=Corynebacterium cystitidis TaxID=35757 RepID=UPI00211EA8AC|nr:hypothetical protein [Corynebacterium cystitidis]